MIASIEWAPALREAGEPRRRTSFRRVLRLVAVVVVLAIATFTLRGQVPDFADVGAAVRAAEPGWLGLAGLSMFVSMGMFARQQRRLLTAFGVTLPRHRALALAYSRSAMSISLPAGSLVSAGFAYRQFLAGGVDRRAAATVMVLSGVLSAAGLVLLYASGLLASAAFGLSAAWRAHPAIVFTAGMALAVTIALLFRFASRSVGTRHWLLALAAAIGNWSADLLCLVFVAQAFELPVSPVQLGAVFLGVQIIRQLPLTPGGIGVIEASLLAGLVSAGAQDAAAAASVLAYRVLSCWLIIPMGLLGWLVLRPKRPSGSELP